jgi:hypothetical protein
MRDDDIEGEAASAHAPRERRGMGNSLARMWTSATASHWALWDWALDDEQPEVSTSHTGKPGGSRRDGRRCPGT